jgi:RNA-directed DNA polymerase
MTSYSTDDWIDYFRDIGLDERIYDLYLPYVDHLLANKLPVILDFAHLAGLLGRSKGYVASVVNGSSSHYRMFSIKKKSGGLRKIEAPYPALLQCQKWIYENVLKHIPVHQCAHGFRPNRSIVSNAEMHVGGEEILNVDIKNFFPSISIDRIIRIFRDLGYPKHVAFYMAAICCLDGKLPQGAPTSPVLSNLVARQIDARLYSLCRKHKIIYSRYADDLTFSGNAIPLWLISLIEKIIMDCGFRLNAEKTRMARKNANRKIVTGIVVKADGIAVPRSYRRKLVQETYFIRKFGLQGHLAKRKIADAQYLNRLQGKLAYWRHIEKDSVDALADWRFVRKLGREL